MVLQQNSLNLPQMTLHLPLLLHVGRGRFFIVNNCEEEPEVFDWNRLSELQRRNTLCLPHLQTSYPVETQTRPPQEISDDSLKLGETTEGSGGEMMTRSMRKRKSGDLELPPGGGPTKVCVTYFLALSVCLCFCLVCT